MVTEVIAAPSKKKTFRGFEMGTAELPSPPRMFPCTIIAYRANVTQGTSSGERLRRRQRRGRGDTVSREEDLEDSKCCCCERCREGQSERARDDSKQELRGQG